MSWKRFSNSIVWYSVFKGLYTQEPVADMPQDGRKGECYLAQANDVYAPGISAVLKKRPGFTKVRSTTINVAGAVTGMVHMGEIADEFLLSVSITAGTHNVYRDNANPPAAIAGGTNFTVGIDNLVDWVLFTDGTNPGAIAFNRLRNTPQFFVAATTRSDFSITGTTLPQFGEVFGSRLLMAAPSVGGTVYDDRVYYSDLRDGNLISDTTTQFLSFETAKKDKVRALKVLSDICLVGKLHNIFVMAVTPTAGRPYAVRELPGGRGRGPVSHQGVVEADSRLIWMGQSNIHSLDLNGEVKDLADVIKPTINGLLDTGRDYTVAAYDQKTDMVLFNVYDAGDTTKDLCIALNIKTGAIYLWNLKRNAYATRLVSGQPRVIGGGYGGFFYNEFTGTAGAADDATTVIDSDVYTPRFRLSAYGHTKKIPFVILKVDPIGTESITVEYRLDDSTTWIAATGSPFTVSGTDDDQIIVPIGAVARRIQLRFRNNTAAEVYSIKQVGIPGMVLQPEVA
jgi:hypothetical protein